MFLQVAIWICVAVACVVAGKYIGTWLFGAKKDVSNLRRSMQSLAIALREHGLKRLPSVLEEAVVGDLDDVFVAIKEFAVVVKAGNSSIVQELEGTFEKMLGAKLDSPEGRTVIEAKLNAAKVTALAVAKVAAPIVIAAL